MKPNISLLIIVLCFSTNFIFAQNFQSGKTTITFTDISRNRQIPTDIYYPANTAGNNVSIASGNTRFPVVVFGHGFSLGTSSYTKLGDTLAKYGYVAAFPSTETGFAPSHDNFGKDLSFLCNAIINTDLNSGSLFYNRLIHKAAVGGHSMGGGCSFLAAATQNPLIFGLFNMSAAETNPSATTAASTVNIPTLIFSGSNDCIVAPSVQQAMYNNVVNSCKSIANITGATHCQFADNNFTCTFGQISSGCNSSPISVATVYEKVTALLIPFLDYHLKDNCYRGIDYVTSISSLSGITAQNTCPIPVCQILPLDELNFYGRMINKKAIINWEVKSLDGLMKFELEKSEDAINFEKTGIVNTDQSLLYTLTDNKPFPGTNYYRLKTIKQNNDFAYSKTISLTNNTDLFEISNCYPNPSEDFISIVINAKIITQINIEIFNGTGSVMLYQKSNIVNGKNDIRLDIKKFPTGIYHIKIKDKFNKTLKIMKCNKF